MRLLIVRHGDPDYEHDTLTQTGWKEAELAAERIAGQEVKEFYLSPLGRAQDTASCILKKLGRTGITCDWLREFWPGVIRPDTGGRRNCVWDWLPQDWTGITDFYRMDTWSEHPVMQEAHVKEAYDQVCAGLDGLLLRHGYEREGRYYRVKHANRDTLVFYCHFGIECVMLSHLLSVSPMILWQGFSAAPSSVTTVYTEERREGIASFRVSSFGDISHLYAAGREPSFAARFCECFDNKEERHD